MALGLIRPIRDRATFAALAGARRLRAGPVWLRVADGPTCTHPADPAVAFAVTRSTGSAVERNRVRRRLRAAVAEQRGDLVAGSAYLFGADRRALHLSYPALTRAVREVVRASRAAGPDVNAP